jgi:aryl-alcohol dehydrogenase-like predicted oxidoreductase
MSVETIELAPGYVISRVIRGGWQLAAGHGTVDRDRALADMPAFLDAGITVFDCADIYTGVEELYGRFREHLRRERGEAAARAFRVHTKYAPDYDALATLGPAQVRATIERSLLRLKMERLDLVQYHWWNYTVPGYIDAARVLVDLAREGKIRCVGVTNFDTPHTAALIDAGVPVVSAQVQYSLLDQRAEAAMAALCARTGMQLLCYGALAGGFISERWLGAAEPTEPFENRSLVKYKLVIDDFGGWDVFQSLLAALNRVGARHGVSLSAVAIRWVLDQPHVGAAIVGARYAHQLDATLGAFRFALDAEDRQAIGAALAQGRPLAGDVYALERDKEGRHGRIMKYNLSKS